MSTIFDEFELCIDKLKKVLETTYEDICLCYEKRDDSLCESAIPKLELYLIEGVNTGRKYLLQEQNRLLSPEGEKNRKFQDEMNANLRKMFFTLKMLACKGAPHFYTGNGKNKKEENKNEMETETDGTPITYTEKEQEYVNARLRGENWSNPWGWYSMHHLKVSMLLIEKMVKILTDLAHTDEFQTDEVTDRLAMEDFFRFKGDREIVRQNYLSFWKEELNGAQPTMKFINEKKKELRDEFTDKTLLQLAQNYKGNWHQLIAEMKGNYGYDALTTIFMYYFKIELVDSLKDNELKKEDSHILDIKEILKNSILQLQEERIMVYCRGKNKEEYLFQKHIHWMAVFRVLVDKGYFSNTDYNGFTLYMEQLDEGSFRIPCKYDSLKSISKMVYSEPLRDWQYDPVYHNTREPYERMLRVANRYLEIFQQHLSR